MSQQVTEQDVLQALRQIKDPDLHKDIVTLGFIKDLKIEGGVVSFRIVLTTPACPVKSEMESAAREIVGSASHAFGPASTVSMWGRSASLISHVAEFHR